MNTLINRVKGLINSPSTEESRNELNEIRIILKGQLNLCNTCKHEIPTCNGAGDSTTEFGIGRGNDNIIHCNSYEYKS